MPLSPWILFATSEIYPFSKTGGLGDVMGALPLTLHNMGINTAVITPLYGRIKKAGIPFHLISPNLHVGYPWYPITADIYRADFHGMPVYFVSRDEYFQRKHFYNNYKGDYFDNCERFIFFCRAVMEWARIQDTPPAVINCNDWQTALLPGFLMHWRMGDAFWAETRSVLSIHNLAFQGRFASRLFWDSGLPHWAWNMDGAEYWGDFNLLKTGLAYCDHITTVSPMYADEIITPEFGCGLEGILSKRADSLTGIINGADYQVWDPSNDPMIPAPYSVDSIEGKAVCKQALIDEQGLNPFLANRPILGFIGRLQLQKGIDLLLEIFERIIQRNVGIVVLGEGNLHFEERLLRLMEEYPLRLSANVSYTEDLAHRIQAGSDIFLMPSRYEPCGLTQMYSLRYGTPPVATAVGGLKDTIVPYPHPECTGFIFDHSDADLFYNAICQALDVWEHDKNAWREIQLRAMRQNFSWELSANKYLSLYNQLGTAL